MTGVLDAGRRNLVEAAWERLDEVELADLVAAMVDIPSATGEEGELARWAATVMAELGAEATVQELDDWQANAVGRRHGAGGGSDLLLYAPIDTVLAGRPEEDLPMASPVERDDLVPVSRRTGPYVIGLGASNPKGHGACILGALSAVSRAGIELSGDLLCGFGAGGMPTNYRPAGPGNRRNTGQGVGCSFMLEQGVWADAAVIAKPGWTVAHEEVGLCWFEVEVAGIHTYVGSRHRLPYRNAITDAAYLVEALESWFEHEWSGRHESGLVRPQGIVGAIQGGWQRMPSFTGASCRFLVDLRVSPRTTPSEARREFEEAVMKTAAGRPGLTATVRPVLSIPGTITAESDPIIRSTIAAWEAVTGRPHEVIRGTSGATDANILRGRGIPTARVGMPKVADAPFDIDFEMGMNTVDVRDMVELCRLLIHVIVDTCTRPAPNPRSQA